MIALIVVLAVLSAVAFIANVIRDKNGPPLA